MREICVPQCGDLLMARKYIEITELKLSSTKREERKWVVYPGQKLLMNNSMFTSDSNRAVYTLEVDPADRDMTFGKFASIQRNLVIRGRDLPDFCILEPGDSIPSEFSESRKLHRNSESRWEDII